MRSMKECTLQIYDRGLEISETQRGVSVYDNVELSGLVSLVQMTHGSFKCFQASKLSLSCHIVFQKGF